MASNKKNPTDKLYHDEWDRLFYKFVSEEATLIINNSKTEQDFQKYVKDKNELYNKYRERVKQRDRGRVVYSSDTKNGMLGIIAQSTSAEQLKKKVKKRQGNQTSVSLTDLHELYLCFKKSNSLNELMGVPDAKSVSDIVFLSKDDVLNLHCNFCESVSENTLFVVRCVPLLGLSLVLWRAHENNRSRFFYKIVDSLGIFCKEEQQLGVPTEILVSDPPEVVGTVDPGWSTNLKATYDNANQLFEDLCKLAKGILEKKNGERSLRAKEYLGKDKGAGQLPFTRYATLCGLQEDTNQKPYHTGAGVLENTVQLFWDEVKAAQKTKWDYLEKPEKHKETDADKTPEKVIADAQRHSKKTAPLKC